MDKTIIFGGTFNPPHIGHVAMAKAAADLPDTEEVMVLPSLMPVHKRVGPDFATAEQRLEMCRLAFANVKKTVISDFEINSKVKNYSYLTVKRLKAVFPKKNFVFLIGGDSLLTLDTWYFYRELLREVPFYAVKRGEKTVAPKTAETVAELNAVGADITLFDADIPNVSSSDIRKRTHNGEPITGMVAPAVERYIFDNDIYTGGKIGRNGR